MKKFTPSLILVALICVLSPVHVAAQDKHSLPMLSLLLNADSIDTPPPSSFVKIFGGGVWEEGKSVQLTADGGYIICGETQSYGAGFDDVYLIKINSSGNESWAKTFGGSNGDWCNSVQQTADKGFIIAGGTYSYGTEQFGSDGNDVYLVKTDNNGNEIWSKTFGGVGNAVANSVQQTADGGFIIVGFTVPYDDRTKKEDVYLIRVDSSGNKIWSKTFGAEGLFEDEGNSVQQTADGGFIIVGYTKIKQSFYDTFGSPHIYLIKTDNSGNEIWSKTFSDHPPAYGQSVQQTADGGFVVTGYIGSISYPFSDDVFLLKTDSNGNGIWLKTFGGTMDDAAYSVQQTADGGYIIAGCTRSYGAGWEDVYLIKTNSSGNEIWSKTFGGSLRENGNSVQQTADKGYIIAGTTRSYSIGQDGYYGNDTDIYLIKTDSSGNVKTSKPE